MCVEECFRARYWALLSSCCITFWLFPPYCPSAQRLRRPSPQPSVHLCIQGFLSSREITELSRRHSCSHPVHHLHSGSNLVSISCCHAVRVFQCQPTALSLTSRVETLSPAYTCIWQYTCTEKKKKKLLHKILETHMLMRTSKVVGKLRKTLPQTLNCDDDKSSEDWDNTKILFITWQCMA